MPHCLTPPNHQGPLGAARIGWGPKAQLWVNSGGRSPHRPWSGLPP